ncbi:MAG TPA: MaoC/PaaZ C-terminal domain-containing protein [Nocardioidaceae bacterium]|nr:MaoC/PaaZ C-terminal domain-containing protein [Nocardioidaceae bacterium]
MTSATTREIQGTPNTLPLLLKAALPVLPGASLLPGIRKSGSTLPQLTLTRHDVPVDRDHVAAYSEVCGFGLREALPVSYPHMLAFPLHLALMTDGAFPFPAVGLVHIENSITAHRAISAAERLQVTARPQDLRAHPKGRAFDIVTQVHSAGELVWEETSTFLRRGASAEGDGAVSERSFEEVPASGIEWNLSGDAGRRYAAVSGDHNPIHLYGVTAKAFGFPRQIAHGMWSKARCLAALEGRLPDAVRVDVAFKKPILLPSRVAFGSRPVAGGSGRQDFAFSLTSPKDGAPHLLGRTTALD